MTRVTAMLNVKGLLGVQCGTVIPAPAHSNTFPPGIKGSNCSALQITPSSYLFAVKGSWKQPKLSLSI